MFSEPLPRVSDPFLESIIGATVADNIEEGVDYSFRNYPIVNLWSKYHK